MLSSMGDAKLDLREHRLQYRMNQLMEHRKLDVRRVQAVTTWILAAGLSVILLNVLITLSIGFETILDDYRLLFLVPFSLLTGVFVISYAYYYRKSATARVYQTFLTRMDKYEYEMDRLASAASVVETPPVIPMQQVAAEAGAARPLPERYV